ncbi:MAG: glycerophosphodiester phosphodiesterase [Rhodobacteraceae bacterium]|nr:glycerophosphodiester phosphodiesterase [Paracoccaceae bacterium]
MSHLSIVFKAYSDALSRWRIILPVYLFLRVLAFAIIAPLIGLLINAAVALSDQPALTDQDIAMFLLTPAGFVLGLIVLSVILASEIGSFAVIAETLRLPERSPLRLARLAIAAVVARARALTVFSAMFILRVLAIALPFLLVCMLIALWKLTEFDINYYLTFKPPEFWVAVALIGGILLAMALVLLFRLSGWAITAHLVLFGGLAPGSAFVESQARMEGQRGQLQMQLVLWLAVRVFIAQVLLISGTLVMQWVPMGEEANLNKVLFLVLAITSVWIVAGVVLGAIALGALAVLLDRYFIDDSAASELPEVPPGRRLAIATVALGAVAGVGIWMSAALLESVKTGDDVEVIAHRGAAGSRPENTMAAIEQAIEDAADWIEIDVQESRDGQVVVIHDADFMKLAGNPTRVWEADFAELAEIDIGSWFDPAFADQRTPLLSDVLATAKGRGKVLIELKHYGHAVDLEQRVVDLVEAAGMERDIAIMSLSYPSVRAAQRLRPGWRTGVLAASAVGNLAGLQGNFLAVRSAIASPALLNAAHSAGKDVYVWTVNDPLSMSRMISKGVDGLITDEPALARHVLSVRAEMSTAERMALWLASELGLQVNPRDYRDESP